MPFVRASPFAAALTFAAAVAAPAGADPVTADIALTLNPILGGVHESYNDRVDLPPIPIPLLEARVRSGPLELDLEGLPPLTSVPYHDALQGRTSTRLSIVDGIARVWDPLHRYSAGIGPTVYNQGTHYADAIEVRGSGETQSSRVSGFTYLAGYEIPLHGSRFEGALRWTPVMHGVQFTTYDVGTHPGRIDPERAEQIDVAIRYVRHIGTTTSFILGLRYLNYTAVYDEPRGGLSDRNVGLLPTVGYRVGL